MRRIYRILLLPIGLIFELFNIAVKGSRNIYNSFRFKNTIVDLDCLIHENSKIGKHCRIYHQSVLNNVQIGNFSYIGKNSIVQNTTIGNFCSIANGVMIGLGAHPIDFFSTSPIFYKKENCMNYEFLKADIKITEYKPIVIGHDVWIGAKVIIKDGVSIGNGAIIGAGSIILKDVPPYAIVVGVPGKVIKYRFEQKIIDHLELIKWWNWDISKIKLEYESLKIKL